MPPKRIFQSILALLLALPAIALAADAEVKTQEELLAALESEQHIALMDDLSTDTDIFLKKDTVIDLNGFSWTVDGGTLAYEKDTLIGGTPTASKRGTIRFLTPIALENAAAGEVIRSVTYSDGETDSAATYIENIALDANRTAELYLKRNKTVSRVTTSAATYRLGTADDTRLSLVYSIAYHLDGGQLQAPNPTEYTAADAPITLGSPVREGYRFLGWAGTGLSEPTETVTIPMGSTGNRTYTAVWEEAADVRPSGGGSRPSIGSSRPSAGTETAASETSSAEPSAAPKSTPTPSASRRISTASSSVDASFDGARPILTNATPESPAKTVRLPRLLLGAALLTASAIGAIALIKRRGT